jgi:hypothetical protein
MLGFNLDDGYVKIAWSSVACLGGSLAVRRKGAHVIYSNVSVCLVTRNL